MTFDQIPTPALLVDLEKLEHNLKFMADFFADGPVRLRPHFKNHKCLELARRQLAAGAVGITCATLREAESLVDAGFKSILIANEVTSREKLIRFLALSEKSDVMLAIDNIEIAELLGSMAGSRGLTPSVLMDVDIGLRRCGVRPGKAALPLAKAIVVNELRLRGIMGYEGHLLRSSRSPAKESAVCSAMQLLADTRAELEHAGLPVEIVSVGGTGSYDVSGRFAGVTELQAGSYLLMETDYEEVCPEFRTAIMVLTTVVSRSEGERVVLDAGVKAISCERGLPQVNQLGLTTERVNAEHTILSVAPGCTTPKLAEQIELRVRYGDGTVNLHSHMYGIRNGVIEEVFDLRSK